MKILLVEDEPNLARDLIAFLESGQHICTHVDSLSAAREAIRLYQYDIVLLDIGLPDGEGLSLIGELLQGVPSPGLLIISAKDSLDDKLKGLDLGADDYLTKPFHFAELNSRIRSVFRRKNLGGKRSLHIGELEIFPDDFQVLVSAEPLSLTPKEFQLLLFMAVNQNKVLTKATLAEHLWGDQADTLDDFDFIYSHIKNLRKKLSQAGATDRIKAVYGVGYKFEGT